MCRGFVENERENLKMKAFYTQLSVSRGGGASVPPDFLTLHFLPRISGGRLEINGSGVRPDSPAFLTLHRVVSAGRGFRYGSRDRVTVCEGARFEVYAGDAKLLKGVFRKLDGGGGDEWRMDCKCVLSAAVRGVGGAEVEVAAEGMVGVMRQKVEMVAPPPARRRRERGRGCCELEEIPEVREEEAGSGACGCSECGGGEGAEEGGEGEGEVEEVDLEAVNWAVDVGIWVVCLGVGYMVSASSFKKLRRKRFV